MAGMTSEKLHKVLARAGLGSRRQIEKWIAEERVSVNGAVAEIGQRIGEQACVVVDGKQVELCHSLSVRVLLYHKPLGELTTRVDPQGRPTVFDRLPPVQGRWVTVGRLDINSTGLLLFTNDGELAAKLMHPATGLQREYQVRVRGAPTAEQLRLLGSGVRLDNQMVRFKSIVALPYRGGSNRRFKVTVDEGRNREVRRLWESIGCQANQLKRTRYGSIALPTDLPPGRWREMKSRAVSKIHKEHIRAVHRSGE